MKPIISTQAGDWYVVWKDGKKQYGLLVDNRWYVFSAYQLIVMLNRVGQVEPLTASEQMLLTRSNG